MKWIVLLAFLLPGCLLLGFDDNMPEQTQGYSSDELAAEFISATSLTFGLADFDGNTLALELVTDPQAPVQVNIGVELSSDEGIRVGPVTQEEATPAGCVSVVGHSFRGQMIGALRMPRMMLSAGGVETGVRAPTLTSTLTNDMSFKATSYDVGYPTPVVVAVGEAEKWRAAGEGITVTLESVNEFWYRFREPGTLTCHMLMTEGEGSTTIDAGSAIVVRDASFPFTVDESNIIGLFIGSDGGHLASLITPTGRDDIIHNDPGQYHWYWGSGTVPAGDYSWFIDEMQGANNPFGERTASAVIVHDVEDWMVAPPWFDGTAED